jgi:Reverse transcriptase (RNA-dependent DNA polymerase)
VGQHVRSRKETILEMPRGFKQPGKVLKLNRSLYGHCQSPRNFFQHLKAKLDAIGFESQESIDSCLFISDKVIVLLYVDDTLLFSPEESYINDAIEELKRSDMELEVEDSIAGFLGVHIERNNIDNTIKLTQQGLAKCIVDALNLTVIHQMEHIIMLVLLGCYNTYKVIQGLISPLQSVNVQGLCTLQSVCMRRHLRKLDFI